MSRKDQTTSLACSFCQKSQREVRKLIAGPTVYICDECIRVCNEIIDEENEREAGASAVTLPTPAELKSFLDQYVVGQEQAKKVLAVAVYNHYKRVHNKRPGQRPGIQREGDIELAKSNILLLGPTGSGKTLLAQSLARFLNVPFTIADATSLTEAGYVGEDVENIVQGLLRAAEYDVERASRGIVYIDEIDKISRKGDSPSSTRDVGGEGVQQALLKIIEGTRANVAPRGSKKYAQQESVQVDTTNVLFICGGAFTGLEETIRRRIGGKTMGFGAELEERKENVSVGELLEQVESDDLIKYGLIPEFVGRLPVVATLKDLSEEDLVTILTLPKNALVKQYVKLFEMDGVKLSFRDEALRAVAKEAVRRGAGARGLRSILEQAMLEIMYEVPYKDGIKECRIHEKVITEKAEPELVFAKEKQSA